MSVEAMTWALTIPGLPASQKLALIGIANHADPDGIAWPGMTRLAGYCGCSERQVVRLVAALEERGLVTVERNGAPDARQAANRRTNRYTLAVGVTPASPQTDSGVTSSAPRGDIQRGSGVTPMSPKTSVEPSTQPSETSAPSASEADPEQEAATEILKAWWEAQTPRPSQNYVGARKIIQNLLHAGWTREQVTFVLRGVTVITRYALETRLREAQQRAAARRGEPIGRPGVDDDRGGSEGRVNL